MAHENKKNLTQKVIGLGLVSGGLDSLIACLLMKLQDIEVIGLNFTSPFCLCAKAYKNTECGLNLVYDNLGINVHSLPKEDDYLEIVRNPKYGHGKNLNPCIDCRIYILKKAKKLMKNYNADFIFTGEVLNQRPKSQHYKALNIVEEESGLKGMLLRPLSALLLDPTINEEQGLIDRSKLLAIRGRSRQIQLEYARKYNLLNNYNACGGCLLTDEKFTNRMRDYLKFNEDLRMSDINFLKHGRHFRYKSSKIIIGRNHGENSILLQIKNPDDIVMEAKDVVGPITIIQDKIDQDTLEFAAKLTLRYSDLDNSEGKVTYFSENSPLKKIIEVIKGNEKLVEKYIL
jgi:tRNA U34 2-thiouridine synthase MnmA/TrmU